MVWMFGLNAFWRPPWGGLFVCVQPGGGLGADLGHTGQIIFVAWLGNRK